MVICPNCKDQVPHDAKTCPNCGTRVIPGDQLEDLSTKTTGWQKFVIVVATILLIAIAFTFYSAQSREDAAAQAKFTPATMRILSNVAVQTGLGQYFGVPAFKLDATTKSAKLSVVFPSGPLAQPQAAQYAQAVCGELARAYVRLGYMPRHITVTVGSAMPNSQIHLYGQAIYNGNIDALGWEPARQ